ncbi:hypothetical protein [Nocardioides sp. TF02-7]|uniref:hypothetical protein n=1 Tax=Nocardioides sp. TF02-7 TaxID=2917724 RepID=UPI001F05CDFD|nr:hypothetical protein [Nocardioides sp. TF02-7]UMG94156.1 hypothetical protein MF408_09030 [Nocardioides sp. TF02-7]
MQAIGRSGVRENETPAPPPKPDPLRKPQPPNRRRRRVPTDKQRERAFTKLTTTTEALTAEERQIIRGYRLSIGGEAAEAARREIEREVRRS